MQPAIAGRSRINERILITGGESNRRAGSSRLRNRTVAPVGGKNVTALHTVWSGLTAARIGLSVWNDGSSRRCDRPSDGLWAGPRPRVTSGA
ncbi:MAG TPA: hypothetical protein VIX73_08555, partial [Kofleriaceae bacterium]